MIEIKALGFGFGKKGPPLFAGLDLRLPSGTLCGLLGANGAGKSTLLRLLAGLNFPQQGSCTVLGHHPGERLPEFLADIFLLPEEVYVPPLLPGVYVQRYGSFYPRFDRAIFETLATDFAFPRDRRLTTFSLGQKKKFLLAFGLATQARLLILDEPTNGLDLPGKSQFRRALISQFAPDRSILISTHQVHDLQGLIDAVIVLDGGRIQLHATLEALAASLQVGIEARPPTDALYVEETLEGYRVVRQGTAGVEAELDLELLYRLAVAVGPAIGQLPGAGA
jgi:ABC-2 type transport system ATP-binding protein